MFFRLRRSKVFSVFSSLFGDSRRDAVFVAVAGLCTILLLVIPTGFEGSAATVNAERAWVRVVQVNNEKLKIIGPVRQGEQQLEVQLLSCRFRRRVFAAANHLMGKMELDKVFLLGDTAFAVLNLNADRTEVVHVQVIDHYRTGKTILLASVFIVALFFKENAFKWLAMFFEKQHVLRNARLIRWRNRQLFPSIPAVCALPISRPSPA